MGSFELARSSVENVLLTDRPAAIFKATTVQNNANIPQILLKASLDYASHYAESKFSSQ